ncbi:hypothetical protein [Nocardiopsis deserti]|uniref:hypothetical protein n=1 Tax=Nocardiopsis deserti TaxID=2605988 RepID=UPI0016814F90|nr:hypothetical protein [Nocardiopsis deserti]
MSELEGELPVYYDHVVRIGVEVDTEHVPGFLALVRSRPWQIRKADEGRYDVHLALAGAALGAVGAALTEFRHACDRAGAHARVTFATRLRPQRSFTRSYPVLPRTRLSRQKWLAELAHPLLPWRARGRIQARSLAEANSLLPEFVKRNPEINGPDELMVVGPPDVEAPSGSAEEQTAPNGYRLYFPLILLTAVAAVVLAVYLFSETGLRLGLILLLVAPLCLLGVVQTLRRMPEGHFNTWLPLILTALAAPLVIALGNARHTNYLWAFGIAPGDMVLSNAHRFDAIADVFPRVLLALLLPLGIFELLRYLHLGSHSHLRLFNWLMPASTVLLYGLIAVSVIMGRDTDTGRAHTEHYRTEGGAPLTHAGIRPSVMCVEVGQTQVQRVGPPLTTDRPVLYFPGTNNTDLLWDREEGLTRVPRFSVTLTPVTDLDSPCPEPTAASVISSAPPAEVLPEAVPDGG